MISSANKKKSMRSIAVFLVEYIMKSNCCSRDEAVEILIKTAVEELAGNPDRLLVL